LRGGHSRRLNNRIVIGSGVSAAGCIVAGAGGRRRHRSPSGGPVAMLTNSALDFGHARGHNRGAHLAGLGTIA